VTTTLRPIRHEDRLSLVEHLDELRKRLIVCIVVFLAAFGVCLWQDNAILDIMNRPLDNNASLLHKKKAPKDDPLERTAAFQEQLRKSSLASARTYDSLAAQADSAAVRAGYEQLAAQARTLAKSVPPETKRRPVTLGVGEPFTATVRIVAYAALLLSLPLLLFQAYAFVLPAFSNRERQVALPLMVMVPFLFIAGVVFAYFMVLPNAIAFLQNFNADNYDILIQAKEFYRFSITVLIAMGIAFQVPVGILAITRMGIISTAQLRHSRRYAFLVCAIVAMLLPGQDPVTMLSLLAPLYLLFEGSILLAAVLDRRAARREADEPDPLDDPES
jgi:sec-independent protein translocase protein TatC